METNFITKINLTNKLGQTARFKFNTYVYIPLEQAIHMAINEMGLDNYLDLKYHVDFYSTRRIN